MDRQRSTVNTSKTIDAAYEAYEDAGIEPNLLVVGIFISTLIPLVLPLLRG